MVSFSVLLLLVVVEGEGGTAVDVGSVRART